MDRRICFVIWTAAVIGLLGLGLAACGGAAAPTTAAPPTTEPQAPAAATTDPGAPPLPFVKGDYFAGSGACALCHTAMQDAVGNDVSNDRFWRGTMMANAARDPYWRASVRKEVARNPAYREAIEDKCATCHTPMARFTAALGGESAPVLDGGFLDPDHALHTLALDGVSCTLCHQVQAAGLGEPESFSGNFAIDVQAPMGERAAFGPFPVDEALAPVMQASSGFDPNQGSQVKQAELCGTCHTLFTPTISAAGEIEGEFPEQTPYLEWQHSAYRATRSCQGCHMPLAEGGVVLSTTGGQPRSPFSIHEFVGGNTYLPQLLAAHGEELGGTASAAQFAETQQRALVQLQEQTAALVIEAPRREGTILRIPVQVKSLAGHKLPSGFPSRRVWLHITVTGADGELVFESGKAKADGSIEGNANDADGRAYEPHYLEVQAPDQVQIYEAVMADTEGRVTTTLMFGAGYLKDNRLLPDGFDPQTAAPEIAVYGAAAADPDFTGGSDRVEYVVDLGARPGPFTVQVELLYQVIGYRWIADLQDLEGIEPGAFLRYAAQQPPAPVQVAEAGARVE